MFLFIYFSLSFFNARLKILDVEFEEFIEFVGPIYLEWSIPSPSEYPLFLIIWVEKAQLEKKKSFFKVKLLLYNRGKFSLLLVRLSLVVLFEGVLWFMKKFGCLYFWLLKFRGALGNLQKVLFRVSLCSLKFK